MGDFILKYWVEFLFGLIITIGGFMLKHHFKLFKDSLTSQIKEHDETIVKEVTKLFEKSDTELKEQIQELRQDTNDQIDGLYHEIDELKLDMKEMREDINHLRKGVLDMQGPQFKAKCRELLNESHQISLDEWLEIKNDYEAYTGIGGNSDGCTLFKAVEHKYENFLEK